MLPRKMRAKDLRLNCYENSARLYHLPRRLNEEY